MINFSSKYVDIYTDISSYLHSNFNKIPNIIWYILIAYFSSSLLKWMHRDDKSLYNKKYKKPN